MHHNTSTAVRHSVTVERDWITDEWVVTRALSRPDGQVITSVASRYHTSMFSADDVCQMLFEVAAQF